MYSKNLIPASYVHWIAAFGVFILMTQVGIQIGWTAPNIAKLSSNDSYIQLDSNEISWVVSIGSLAGIAGAVLGAVGVEFIGSRISIFVAFLLMAISWICMILATSVTWLYVSRALGGIVMAITYSCFSIYLAEVADPTIRGTLVSVAAGGNPFGIVVATIAETYLSMTLSSSLYLAQCLVAVALFLWLKDSPYFLVKQDELDQARESISFYRSNCDVEKEMVEIQSFVESRANKGLRDKLRDLNSPTVKKALFLIVTLFALPHISGTMNVSYYMEVILKKGKSDLIEPQRFVIYANVTSFISTLLTFKLIDKLGRRVLLIVSSLGTAIAMTGLGAHFYLIGHGFDANGLKWLPVFCILAYLIAYSIGFSPVPSTVLSEIFTDNVKSTAALTATLSAPLFSFVVTKAYQPMVDFIGETYVFWIHAILSLVATPYALFLLPETKGKTFQEIQSSLRKKASI